MGVSASGIDIRQMNGQIVFDAFIQGLGGATVTSGTAVLRLYEVQDDGTLLSYDFDDDTFKATSLTTEDLSMTHQTGNNGGTDTGIWTCVLSTLTGFTEGAIYHAKVVTTDGVPTEQCRKFQYGSANNAYDLAGMIRRTHALAGGTVSSKDHSAANPTWVHKDEAGTATLVTETRTVSDETETITPS